VVVIKESTSSTVIELVVVAIALELLSDVAWDLVKQDETYMIVEQVSSKVGFKVSTSSSTMVMVELLFEVLATQ